MRVHLSVDSEAGNQSPFISWGRMGTPSAASDLQASSITFGCGARLLIPDLMAQRQTRGDKEGSSVNPIKQCVLDREKRTRLHAIPHAFGGEWD